MRTKYVPEFDTMKTTNYKGGGNYQDATRHKHPSLNMSSKAIHDCAGYSSFISSHILTP